jgi:hypothetical protein
VHGRRLTRNGKGKEKKFQHYNVVIIGSSHRGHYGYQDRREWRMTVEAYELQGEAGIED